MLNMLGQLHRRANLPRVCPASAICTSAVCDSCPPDLTGTISFISPQAEYTPPVIYSESSRAKLVYRIEARPPPKQAFLLNPGQPVVVRPIAKDGSQ